MAAAVSCSELACCSVRLERSWLPEAISPVARRTDSADSRMRSSTAAIFSVKLLKAWPMSDSSSRPCTCRRRVKSPSPEAMSCSALRTVTSGASMRRTVSPITSAATTMHARVLSVATWPRRVSEAKASARSAATTSIQGVPCTLAA